MYKTNQGIFLTNWLDLRSPQESGFSVQELQNSYYELSSDELIYESTTFEEIDDFYNQGESLILEMIGVLNQKLESKIKAFQRALNRVLPEKMQSNEFKIGQPKKSRLFATKTVQLQLADGQSIFVVFYSPTGDIHKIKSDDFLIAFRFLLNKKDITASITPEYGKELPLKTVVTRIAQLTEANSEKFQQKQALQREQEEQAQALEKERLLLEEKIADLKEERNRLEIKLETKKERLQQLKQQLIDLKEKPTPQPNIETPEEEVEEEEETPEEETPEEEVEEEEETPEEETPEEESQEATEPLNVEEEAEEEQRVIAHIAKQCQNPENAKTYYQIQNAEVQQLQEVSQPLSSSFVDQHIEEYRRDLLEFIQNSPDFLADDHQAIAKFFELKRLDEESQAEETPKNDFLTEKILSGQLDQQPEIIEKYLFEELAELEEIDPQTYNQLVDYYASLVELMEE